MKIIISSNVVAKQVLGRSKLELNSDGFKAGMYDGQIKNSPAIKSDEAKSIVNSSNK